MIHFPKAYYIVRTVDSYRLERQVNACPNQTYKHIKRKDLKQLFNWEMKKVFGTSPGSVSYDP